MFLGLGMKRAHRAIRDRNDGVRVVFACVEMLSEIRRLEGAKDDRRKEAPISGKIRPGIDETGAALFSYRKYAGLAKEPSKVTGGATLSHCTLGTYFGALPNTNLQQKSR